MELADVLALLADLPPKEREAVRAAALADKHLAVWAPNPGQQTAAYYTDADETFYGGQAGGGKTDLIVGLSLTEHKRSLILRRTNKEASKLVDRYVEVLGHDDGWSGQRSVWKFPDGRVIDIGGCEQEKDKQKFKGNPHDLIAFDEIPDFLESQYRFIKTWNRSTVPGQRCRVLACGNPPTTPEGLWVIRYWAPWLDPTHPNPALPGELRWYVGDDEVEGPGTYMLDGRPTAARSRTYIPAALSDNPDLEESGYDAVLASLPDDLRAAYREGRFDSAIKDEPDQVIPTSWIKAAQARWTEKPPAGVPMTGIGVDIAQGGQDETVVSPVHDWYFAEQTVAPGVETPDGRSGAGLVVQHRRDGARVTIDLGGGYGGSTLEHLRDNDVEVVGYKGAEKSVRRSEDRQYPFFNKRAEAYWRLREAMDPGQEGGSPIALPPCPTLCSDLAAPRFTIGSRGIQITPKEELVKLLGRSPDRGDAAVIAWYGALKSHPTVTKIVDESRPDNRAGRSSRQHVPQVVYAKNGRNRTPQVNFGRRR